MSTEQLARLASEVSHLASLQLAQNQSMTKPSEIQAQGTNEPSSLTHGFTSDSALVSAARVAVASEQGLPQDQLEAIIEAASPLEVRPPIPVFLKVDLSASLLNQD